MYKQSDVESQEWMVFLEALRAHFPGAVTVARIVEHIQAERHEDQQALCDPEPDLAEVLPSIISEGKGDLSRRLGKGLARKVDHIFRNRLVLRKDSKDHQAITWLVEEMPVPPGPGS